MNEFFVGLSSPERVYFLSAIGGGLAFVMLTALMFIGGGAEGDGGGMEADGGSADTDASFKALSLHGLSAFFMMFGLVALAAVREFDASQAVGGLYGAVAGVLAVMTLQRLFQLFIGLQEAGNLDPANAVGTTGVVYLGIPADGAGQVELTVQGRMKVMDAISAENEAIPTGSRVRVVALHGGNTLSVVRSGSLASETPEEA